MSTFLVTDTPTAVGPHHRVAVWLGKDHGPLPGKVTVHARALEDFLDAAIEHVQPALLENFECSLTGDQKEIARVAEYLLERYKYASRQAHFDLNTMRWTYKISALQTVQKIARLPDQINAIDQLQARHPDEACLIIGAGPSLDVSSIEVDKILTIATSRAAVWCLRAGWCPDYIIHIDPDPFENLRAELVSHPLIHKAKWIVPFQAHQNFVNLPGQTFWFGSRLNPASVWMAREVKGQSRIPLIVSGGSVSCCAYTIAEFMGCSPICLIGQDLSYRGLNQYSENVVADRFSGVCTAESDSLFLPAIGGGRVQTTMDYMNYADWFVRQSKATRKKIINCTTHGVSLPGFEHTRVQNVYDRYCGQKRPAPATPAPRAFVRPDIRGAIGRALSACDRIDSLLSVGNYSAALEAIRRTDKTDGDGYVVTSCTQFESKIMAYFAHLPPSHPKMKRCMELMAVSLRAACGLMTEALAGRINVPPITEEEITRRMQELREINALAF